MNLNRIGLMIGVLALILAVPLSVVANLLTPWVRDWWSTSSQTRLLRRIKKLETKLQAAESGWKFTPAEWSIRRGVYHAVLVLFFGLHVIFSILLLVPGLYHDAFVLLPIQHPVRRLWELNTAVLMGYIGNLFLGTKTIRLYRQAREMHSDVGLDELKKELEKLKVLVE